MNFYRKLMKLPILKKILIILALLLVILIFSNCSLRREGFNNPKRKYEIKRGNEIYDETYTNIYDNLVYNPTKNLYEVDKILALDGPKNNIKILDIGCGTGHHVDLFNKNKIEVIGIDKSEAMIEQARKNYPELKFKVSNALNTMEFMHNSFSYITCFYFTIYYIKNKALFFQNCFDWLVPGGFLVLHLVNIKKFDPILPAANPFVIISPQNYSSKRLTKSVIEFEALNYNSKFILDEKINANSITLSSPNALFKETIKFKNSNKTRVNEHNLYMQSRHSILSLAKDVGFILHSLEEMTDVKYEHNYLYFLLKPT